MWSWLSGRNGKRQTQGPGDSDTVPHLRDVLPRISVEFERARRYDRTVTVGVFFCAAEGGPFSSGRQPVDVRAAVPLGHVLLSAMREIDLVTCHPTFGFCVVVMPEIGAEEGRRAVSRMRRLCADRLGLSVTAGIAVFPQDGWLFLDLVDVAQRHARAEDDDRLVQGHPASPNPSPA